jgi:hypothetical protein
MKDTVIFHLARYSPPGTTPSSRIAHSDTVYERIRRGEKTSEWRDFNPYWQKRLLLCYDLKALSRKPIECTGDLRVHKAWFVQGYPKGNMPRIEAQITGLIYHPAWHQFEIQFKRTREVRIDGVECFWR